MDWGVHELIIVNMFLISRVADKRQYGEQSAFRWQLICEVLSYCDQLDGQTAAPVTDAQRQEVVERFHPDVSTDFLGSNSETLGSNYGDVGK